MLMNGKFGNPELLIKNNMFLVFANQTIMDQPPTKIENESESGLSLRSTT